MGIDFFYNSFSPPSRMAFMSITALDLKPNITLVDFDKNEQKTPEFLAVNPRGKLPALRDGDLCIGESRAISTYVCNMYEKDSPTALYPKDPKVRAKVDQLLYLSENSNDSFLAYANIVNIIFGKEFCPNEEKLPELHKELALYEHFLSKNEFMAANHLTLADFFMASPMLLLPMTGFDDYGNYPKTVAWLKKIRSLKYFDQCNAEGLKKMESFYKSSIEKNKGKK